MATTLPPQTLSRMAIEAALAGRWAEALEYNKALAKVEPGNVECMNRLAHAYFTLGKYSIAKKIYQEVLKLDSYNTIAQKNLKKVSVFKKNVSFGKNQNLSGASPSVPISPNLFIEEPGITKVVTLVKVAEPQKLLSLSAGMLVALVPKGRRIAAVDSNNQYLGVLPDDTSHHLIRLIKGGNKYQAFIKSIKLNGLTILIREIFRSKKFKNQSSFIDDARALTYSSDNISLLDDDEGNSESLDEQTQEETL